MGRETGGRVLEVSRRMKAERFTGVYSNAVEGRRAMSMSLESRIVTEVVFR